MYIWSTIPKDEKVYEENKDRFQQVRRPGSLLMVITSLRWGTG